MNTSKCHYCYEGEQREILLGVFTHFCRFSRGAFLGKSPISTGRNGRSKLGNLLNLISNIGDKIKQLLNYYHCFDIQEAGFFSNARRFY